MSEQQVYVNRYLRYLWLVIVLLALVVGFFTGLAIGMPDFWLRPAEGFLIAGMTVVIALTVAKIHKLRAG